MGICIYTKWDTLQKDTYEKLVFQGQVLTKDRYGDKVIKLRDGRIAKLFRLKRVLSSALIWPYSRRFVKAVHILEKVGIPTVKLSEMYRVPSIKRDLVVYLPLEGDTLRELVEKKQNIITVILSFASFLAKLHNQGIYFRSIHFNNVIVVSEGKFGLIDVTDFQYFSSRPLSIQKRVKNLKAILKYKEDRDALALVGVENFLKKYIESAVFKTEKTTAQFMDKALSYCSNKIE